MDLGGSGWIWVELGGSEWIRMDLGGSRWIRVDLGESGDSSNFDGLQSADFSNFYALDLGESG